MASHTCSKCFKSALPCLWHQSLSCLSEQDHISTWTSSNKRLKALPRHRGPSASAEAFLLFASCPFPFYLGVVQWTLSLAFLLVAPARAGTLHLTGLMKERASLWSRVPCPDLGCSLPCPPPLHSPPGTMEQQKAAPGRDPTRQT